MSHKPVTNAQPERKYTPNKKERIYLRVRVLLRLRLVSLLSHVLPASLLGANPRLPPRLLPARIPIGVTVGLTVIGISAPLPRPLVIHGPHSHSLSHSFSTLTLTQAINCANYMKLLLKDPTLALGHLEELRHHHELNNNHFCLCHVLLEMGNARYTLEDYDSALSIYNEACDVLTTQEQPSARRQRLLQQLWHGIANVYKAKDDTKSALEYYGKSTSDG